jgi:hypothetical protein
MTDAKPLIPKIATNKIWRLPGIRASFNQMKS